MRRYVFGLLVVLSAIFILLFSLSVDAVQQMDTSATRTAIAITREPILGTPATPSSIDLTATVAFKQYEDNNARMYHQPAKQLEATASAIVAWATQASLDLTVSPVKSSTPFPTVTDSPCVLYFYKPINETATQRVTDTLKGTTLQGSLTIYSLELTMPYNCPSETHFLRTDVEISLKVSSLKDDVLIAAVEELLSYLQNAELKGDGQSLRLLIEFHVPEQFCQLRRIDTGYNNARLAYQEGLRGKKLIEALGGMMDTNKDLNNYCPLYPQ